MMTVDAVRLGVIGLGNIGKTYVDLITSGEVAGAMLGAVSSRTESDSYSVPHFSRYEDLLDSGLIDAVVIATPTMSHPEMGAAAAARGLPVLVDKPLAMSVEQASALVRTLNAQGNSAVMLNQRFDPYYQEIHRLIHSGEIGDVMRFSWMMTAWYRPDVYFEVSAWRGTWVGEGGGLLINQCIHNLDVLQWLVGLPSRVSAIAGFGKYHTIDVEDEFTATLSYDSGATGVVVASSGEAPGINQLDIIGDRGSIRYDGEALTLKRSDVSVREHCRDTSEMFGMPQFRTETIVPPSANKPESQHAQVLRNFVASIASSEALLTPVSEGVASLQLANAILLSAWQNQVVELPIDAAAFEAELQARVSASSLRTPSEREVSIDMDKSYR